MSSKITPQSVQAMVTHWLSTPVNAYLGSDYGSDLMPLLQLPLRDHTAADAAITKLRTDVPIITALPPESTAIYTYAEPEKVDSLGLVVEVAGQAIDVPRQ